MPKPIVDSAIEVLDLLIHEADDKQKKGGYWKDPLHVLDPEAKEDLINRLEKEIAELKLGLHEKINQFRETITPEQRRLVDVEMCLRFHLRAAGEEQDIKNRVKTPFYLRMANYDIFNSLLTPQQNKMQSELFQMSRKIIKLSASIYRKQSGHDDRKILSIAVPNRFELNEIIAIQQLLNSAFSRASKRLDANHRDDENTIVESYDTEYNPEDRKLEITSLMEPKLTMQELVTDTGPDKDIMQEVPSAVTLNDMREIIDKEFRLQLSDPKRWAKHKISPIRPIKELVSYSISTPIHHERDEAFDAASRLAFRGGNSARFFTLGNRVLSSQEADKERHKPKSNCKSVIELSGEAAEKIIAGYLGVDMTQIKSASLGR